MLGRRAAVCVMLRLTDVTRGDGQTSMNFHKEQTFQFTKESPVATFKRGTMKVSVGRHKTQVEHMHVNP